MGVVGEIIGVKSKVVMKKFNVLLSKLFFKYFPNLLLGQEGDGVVVPSTILLIVLRVEDGLGFLIFSKRFLAAEWGIQLVFGLNRL